MNSRFISRRLHACKKNIPPNLSNYLCDTITYIKASFSLCTLNPDTLSVDRANPGRYTAFMRFLSVLSLLLTFSFSAYAQALLSPIKQTHIPFGPNANEIGIEKGEGENWKPLFFSVDNSGNIAVPDFYKGRIAMFSPEGKFLKGLQLQQGISPRMNYFGANPSGGYVTYTDYALYCLSTEGRVNWSRPFGIGAIPERVYPCSTGIFVLFSAVLGPRQGTMVFSYSSPQPMGTYGYGSSGGMVPLIAAEGGKPFALKLGDMRALPEYGQLGFNGPQEAILQYVTKDHSSIWSLRVEGNEAFFLYSAKGLPVSSGQILFPEGEAGNGFWTFVCSDLSICKNYFTDDGIEIVKYRLPNAPVK
jgi:hypothetical protein